MFALLSVASAQQLLVLPLPTNFSYGAGCLRLLPSFSFSPTGAGGTDAALAAALSRAQRTLASMGARGESVQPCAPAAGSTLSSLIVAVDSARASPYPALGDDESYALFLAAGDASALRARTVWGALRGLETLTQLVSADRAPDAAGPRLVVPAAWVNVSDRPRFSHRGLMIDTGRAFLPVPLILATLDAMASVKLNVLHWHCTDDQAFPVESVAFPNLTAAGAQQAPSRTHVYSKADVASVVEAAAMRGIRVVPEFDVPGHSSSWFAGYPLLASNCSRSDEFGVPMDPTLNTTYDLLQGLFAEMRAAFPDDFFHIGGDEVDFSCWESAPAIVAFMKAHNLTPPQLQLYFENRVVDLFQGQRQLLIWEGNAGADNTYPLADNVVVNVWKEEIGDLSVLEGLVRAGKRVLFTTRNWYLDWTYVSDKTFDDHVNGPAEWAFYHTDPFLNSTLTPQQLQLVLGAEVCMWSPFTDSTNFFSTVFPRAAAVAERLWSAAGAAVDDAGNLQQRMQAMRCRMVARGIGAAPLQVGFSCPNPFATPYVPPWGAFE